MIEMQYVESMKSLLCLLCEHKFGGQVQKMTVFLVRDQVVDQPMRTTWIGTVQGMSQWDRGKMTGCRPEGEGCSPPGVIDPRGLKAKKTNHYYYLQAYGILLIAMSIYSQILGIFSEL